MKETNSMQVPICVNRRKLKVNGFGAVLFIVYTHKNVRLGDRKAKAMK